MMAGWGPFGRGKSKQIDPRQTRDLEPQFSNLDLKGMTRPQQGLVTTEGRPKTERLPAQRYSSTGSTVASEFQ